MAGMVLGEPNHFAILLDEVPSWNFVGDRTFCNGILLFAMDGSIFPTELITVPLSGEIKLMETRFEHLVDNPQLFSLKKEDAFHQIYGITFPDSITVDNDYSYDMTPNSLEDKGYFIFAVKNGEKVRILAAKMKYILEESRHDISTADIKETFLSIREVKELVAGLKLYGDCQKEEM